MREIEVNRLTEIIEKLCIEANEHLPEDVKDAIKTCRACEDGEIAKGVLDNIIENFDIADSENVPICQDTGMACVFLEIGQDVHFTGGDLNDAINEGDGKPTFFRNLLYCNVFYRSRFHTFFHCSCEPVFRFFSLCQISLVACFSHSFSSSFKYGVIVSYTLRW